MSPVEDTNGASENRSNLDRRRNVLRSSKYPRVAVLLGVSSKWYVPLLLCRALSVTSAVWWALPIAVSFLRRVFVREVKSFDVFDVLVAQGSTTEKRIAQLEVVLAFLWVCLFLQSTSVGRMGSF